MIRGYASSALAARLPMGRPEEIARRIRVWAERRRPRLIYPSSYALIFHFARLAWWVVERIVTRFVPSLAWQVPEDPARNVVVEARAIERPDQRAE
jgi:hypothetical protein